MDRDAVRAMGTTDATPFLENADSRWAAISGWQEDSGDLGDIEEFNDGDEALSDGDDMMRTNVKSDSRVRLFLRLLLLASLPMTPRGVVWRRCNQPRARPPAADLAMTLLGAVFYC